MANFPILKTAAVAQYPATRYVLYRNQTVRFVDGTEQRYRDASGPLHRWGIRLSELDDSEIAAVEEFFAANQGAFGSFAFTDPWDGQVYSNCSLAGDSLDLQALTEMRGSASLVVVENRGSAMLVYPQLATGAMTQFPVRKQRRRRTVVNTAVDGTSIKLADPNGEVTEWQLAYSDLSDTELSALEQFFAAAEGTLNGFVFLDPTSNLLAWSNNLNAQVWTPGPFLTLVGGVTDPFGGTLAWRLSNGGAGAQDICQTLAAPAGYLYCLSAYVRSAQPLTATLLIGGGRAERAVTNQWTRIVFAANGDATASSIQFGLEVPPASSLDVFGLQVEPQAGASAYKATTSGGVYQDARLADDLLTITTTGVNRHFCTVKIIHGYHL